MRPERAFRQRFSSGMIDSAPVAGGKSWFLRERPRAWGKMPISPHLDSDEPEPPPVSGRLTSLPAPIAERAEALLGKSRAGQVTLALLSWALEGEVLTAASAMAFDLFLAAIPLLALAGWLFARLVQNGSAATAVSLLLDTTPSSVRELATQQLGQFSPGAFAPLALLGSLWLGSSAANTCMTLLESRVTSDSRPWWLRRLLAIGSLFGGILIFAIGSALSLWLVGGPVTVLERFGRAREASWLGYLLGFLAVHALATLLLGLFFRIAVHRPGVRRRVVPGALLGSALATLASVGFSFYATSIGRFAFYYGGLAAVAVTLIWLWVVCISVLVGAELNLILEDPETAKAARNGSQAPSRRSQ